MRMGAANGDPWLMSSASPSARARSTSMSTISENRPLCMRANAEDDPTNPQPTMATFLSLTATLLSLFAAFLSMTAASLSLFAAFLSMTAASLSLTMKNPSSRRRSPDADDAGARTAPRPLRPLSPRFRIAITGSLYS